MVKNRTYINELPKRVGQSATLYGWSAKARAAGKIAFITLRDGTGLCQCVMEKNDRTAPFFDTAKKLSQESSITLSGTVHADERAIGGVELRDITACEIIGPSTDYPITPKPHGVEFLFKHRHLWFRSERQHTIIRIRATLIDAIRRFFNDRGFILFDTPIFAPAVGEGTSTLFQVDYFGDPVYLAQTGQLYLEAACMAHERVYCFGPTFRAEKSKTRRHLTEFWMVEPEVAFIHLDELLQLAEDFVLSVVHRVLNDHRQDLISLGRDLAPLDQIKPPFHRIRYQDAVDTLHSDKARHLLERDLDEKSARIAALDENLKQLESRRESATKAWEQEKAAQEIQAAREERAELEEQIANIPTHVKLAAEFEWGGDLGGSDETIISRLHDRPVFVTHYPREVKAFYMRLDRADNRLVENFDMLAPEGYGEVIGGSMREEDHDILLSRIHDHALPVEAFNWYLDLRRYGTVPHGGFGLGVERTLAWLCGLKHIRETIPFPRMMGKVYP
ncbi:MAG: asparagine--tRNA ligase [Phycisphaerales bacterium]|nr:asparagine--tRNA ligase [Phycisphaerales bacterium]